MSYHHRAVRAPRLRRPPTASQRLMMGAIIPALPDFTPEAQINTECANTIQSASADLERARYSVVDQLQKQTFYKVEDFDRMIGQMLAMLTQSKNELTDLRADVIGSAGATAAITEQRDRLLARSSESIDFITPMNVAKERGIDIIDAPGFWRWIEKSLIEVEIATGLLVYAACKKPIFASIAQALITAGTVLLQIVTAAVRAAVAVGSLVGKTVLQIPDKIGAIWSAIKWGALIGGGLWLYREVQRRRGGG